jgi:hypothetical protein
LGDCIELDSSVHTIVTSLKGSSGRLIQLDALLELSAAFFRSLRPLAVSGVARLSSISGTRRVQAVLNSTSDIEGCPLWPTRYLEGICACYLMFLKRGHATFFICPQWENLPQTCKSCEQRSDFLTQGPVLRLPRMMLSNVHSYQ